MFVVGLSTVGFRRLLNLRPDLVDSERIGVNPFSYLMYAAAFFLFLFFLFSMITLIYVMICSLKTNKTHKNKK